MLRKALFLCDANPLIGGGHVMRCLTLAHELRRHGFSCTFASTAAAKVAVPALAASAFPVLIVPSLIDTIAFEEDGHQFDLAVIDSYELGVELERSARKYCTQILTIEDRPRRQYECDILVDQTLARTASDYSGRAGAHTRILSGSRYALVRDCFRRPDQGSSERHHLPAIRRILVTLGLGDQTETLGLIVEEVMTAAPGAMIDVVAGSSNIERLGPLAAQNAGIRLHRNISPEAMSSLMAEADVAIGAGGTSSYERCAVGLPTLLVNLADNQADNAARLASRNAAIVVVPGTGDIPRELARLNDRPDELQAMSSSALAVCDGLGAMRIVSAIAKITARRSTDNDARKVWSWRNDEASRLASLDSRDIPWTDHYEWWQRKAGDPGAAMFTCLMGDEPVACVRMDLVQENRWRVSIVVAPERRGQRLSDLILRTSLDAFGQTHAGAELIAEIRDENAASHRIFTANGFIRRSSTQNVGHYLLKAG